MTYCITLERAKADNISPHTLEQVSAWNREMARHAKFNSDIERHNAQAKRLFEIAQDLRWSAVR